MDRHCTYVRMMYMDGRITVLIFFTKLKRRKLNLKEKFESRTSHFSFKR
jgi:hypothetical protein